RSRVALTGRSTFRRSSPNVQPQITPQHHKEITMDGFKMTFGPDGEPVGTSLEAAMNEPPTASTPTQRIPQQGKMKVLYNTETGESTVLESRPSGASVAPSVEQASARNAQGMPVSLATCGPKDVILIPGMGDATAEVWEQMGMVRKLST